MERKKKSKSKKWETFFDIILSLPELLFYVIRFIFGGIVRLIKDAI